MEALLEATIGGVIAANVDDVSLGETDLDAFWAAAVELDVPVIHPHSRKCRPGPANTPCCRWCNSPTTPPPRWAP